MTYKEAVDEIPYELILLMQRDKAHIADEDSMVEVENESEYFMSHGINLIK